MPISFKKINAVGNKDLDRIINSVQSNIETSLRFLQNKPIVDGVLLQGVQLAVGNNIITHKLGREIFGYIIVSRSAASSVYDNISSSDTKTSFTLNATVACTINIWIF